MLHHQVDAPPSRCTAAWIADRSCRSSWGASVIRTTTKTSAPRLHPLLFDACRCGPAARMRCLACWRWHRHYLAVQQRRRAWSEGRHP